MHKQVYFIRSVFYLGDFSETSEKALRASIQLATRQQARLTLLGIPNKKDSGKSMDVDDLHRVYANACAKLKVKQSSLRPSFEVIERYSQSKVLNVVAKSRADLVVAARHLLTERKGRQLFPSALLNAAPCPALVIPSEDCKMEFKRIVFPVRLKQGRKILYHYLRPIVKKNKSELFIAAFSISHSPGMIKELLDMARALKAMLKTDGITTSTRLSVTEKIGWEIVTFARECGADLIVLTRGLDRGQTAKSGSTYSARVLSNTAVPILVLPG